MSHKIVGSVIVIALSLAVSFASGEPRRGGGGRSEGERSEGERSSGQRPEGERSGGERSSTEKSGNERSGGNRSGGQSSKSRKPPGGAWSEYSPEGKQGQQQFGKSQNESGAEGAAAGAAHSNRNSPQASGAEGAAAGAAHSNRNEPQASGAQGAAAGAAAANRNSPQASGAEGAAAGAAHANRNSPQASGAEGAAAGAAAANRNNPKYSGAQGAAAGAAASNRNNPQYSGAQGAAAGAAAANRNNPQYSGAQGAAAGAAAANRNNPQYSGAQGAAAGAAIANRNAPQYSGAQGAVAGATVANYNAPVKSGTSGAAAGYAAIRNHVDHPGMFSKQWYGEHQGVWTPSMWDAGSEWIRPSWAEVVGQCGFGINTTPISYAYGSNVVCVGKNVVVNGQTVGTAEEFSQQADELAETGSAAEASPNDNWLPLGVFALVRNEHQHPQLIMQLAVNQKGTVRGNYTDEVTDSTLPVHGAIDRQTQRAAWTVGNNKYSVMEAGLSNLTQNEAPALIHKNGTTQKWLLVRLAQSSQGEQIAAPADAPR
jgi:hypothetical protein